MKICVVTCTGKRPRMMPLCSKWLRRQRRQPDAWVISLGEGEDLGDFELPSYATVHRWNPETIGRGLTGQIDTNSKYQIEVMRHVPRDHAAVYFDDDDWYGPNYLSTVAGDLELGIAFTGNGSERRYCVATNRWMHVEKSGCNAGAVGMHNAAIPDWIAWMQDPSTKWSWFSQRGWQVDLRNEAPRVSIKNAPGLGHLFPPVQAKWRADLPPWAKLREWIGGDVDDYIELMR